MADWYLPSPKKAKKPFHTQLHYLYQPGQLTQDTLGPWINAVPISVREIYTLISPAFFPPSLPVLFWSEASESAPIAA